jgi:hypothetical protein
MVSLLGEHAFEYFFGNQAYVELMVQGGPALGIGGNYASFGAGYRLGIVF